MPVSDVYIEDWKDDFQGVDTNEPVDSNTIAQLMADQPRNIKSIFREEQGHENLKFSRVTYPAPTVVSNEDSATLSVPIPTRSGFEFHFAGVDLTFYSTSNTTPMTPGTLIRWQESQGGAWAYGHVMRIYYTVDGSTVVEVRPQQIAVGLLSDIGAVYNQSTDSVTGRDPTNDDSSRVSFPAASGDKTAEYLLGDVVMFVRNTTDATQARSVHYKRVGLVTYDSGAASSQVWFYGDDSDIVPEGALNSDDILMFKSGRAPTVNPTRVERGVFTTWGPTSGKGDDQVMGGGELIDSSPGSGYIQVDFSAAGSDSNDKQQNVEYMVSVTPTVMPVGAPAYAPVFAIRSRGVDGFTFIASDAIPAGGFFDWVVTPMFFSEEP